jgi:hypothetical protein
MPWSLADHGPSAHSVPTTASAKNATGRKEAGCLRESRNERGSTVGTNTMNQMIIKTATAVVDQGMEAATRAGYMSTQRSQNGDRVADKKSEDALARFCVSAAFTMLIQIPVDVAGAQHRMHKGNRSRRPRIHSWPDHLVWEAAKSVRRVPHYAALTADCKCRRRPIKLHSTFQRIASPQNNGVCEKRHYPNGIVYRRRQGAT